MPPCVSDSRLGWTGGQQEKSEGARKGGSLGHGDGDCRRRAPGSPGMQAVRARGPHTSGTTAVVFMLAAFVLADLLACCCACFLIVCFSAVFLILCLLEVCPAKYSWPTSTRHFFRGKPRVLASIFGYFRRVPRYPFNSRAPHPCTRDLVRHCLIYKVAQSKCCVAQQVRH